MQITHIRPVNSVIVETNVGTFKVFPFLRTIDMWSNDTFDWVHLTDIDEEIITALEFEQLIATARKALYD